jgi:hypothetical protein
VLIVQMSHHRPFLAWLHTLVSASSVPGVRDERCGISVESAHDRLGFQAVCRAGRGYWVFLATKSVAGETEADTPGVHVNFLSITAPPSGTPEAEKSTGPPKPAQVMMGLQKFGYALEQATRPSAIGMVVGSSPLALLTWCVRFPTQALRDQLDRHQMAYVVGSARSILKHQAFPCRLTRF